MTNTGKEFWEKTKYQYAEHSSQSKGKKKPPLEKEYPKDSIILELPKPQDLTMDSYELRTAIEKRTSVRKYGGEPLSLTELSYLLWCTQGVKEIVPAVTTFRTVPSAGSCHAFETYMLINNVEGIKPGIYRFLALKHALVVVSIGNFDERITAACLGQAFISTAAVSFFWVAVKERMTWRYSERGYRYLLLDAGHICQNLYLSALSLKCGVCAIAAFHDDDLNRILHLDGDNEFVVYAATCGKRKNREKSNSIKNVKNMIVR